MPAIPKDVIWPAVQAGQSLRTEIDAAPKFRVGDRVTARNINPPTHTRVPRFVRGRQGAIIAHHGAVAFADTRAHGKGDQPQHVYGVRFEGRDLWGPDAGGKDAVHLNMWESYLEPAS